MAGSNFGAWFDNLKKEEAAKENGEDIEEGEGLLGGLGIGKLKLPAGAPSWMQQGLENVQNNVKNPKDTFNGFIANVRGDQQNKTEADQVIMGMGYRRRFQLFVCALLLSILFFGLAFMVGLPTLVLRPHKFAVSFTLGSLSFMGAFAMLKGPSAHLKSMITRERLPFSILYVGSMLMTLYACIGMRSYIFAVLFSALQITALTWYMVTFIPGGSAGMKHFFSAIVRTAKYTIYPCLKGCFKSCQLCFRAARQGQRIRGTPPA